VAADGVMAGAETVRDGNIVLSTWHPELVALRQSLALPRHPAQIVATLRGLTLDSLLFNVPELRVILMTVGECSPLMLTEMADRPWITVVQMPSAHDLPHAFRQLRHLDIARLSCIGGRTIAGQLIDAGLVQDVYLTTSAKSGGEPGTPFYSKPLNARRIVRKHATGADSGVLFEHFRI
jgi:5-amino-6-(5-phosphoribosylamino)uracil reductase